jgi:hypothetical protein
MGIWPRLSRTLPHLVGFLVALLLSKFVIATALYLGFDMVVAGMAPSSPDHASNSLVVGLATLATAAFSPILLIQGVRFAEASASHAARGWGSSAVRYGAGAAKTTARRGAAPLLARLRPPGQATSQQPSNDRANQLAPPAEDDSARV